MPERQESRAPETDSRLDLIAELAKLTPRERACMMLRYYEDLRVADIAEWLGISADSEKRYLSDGLTKMAISLCAEPQPEPSTTTTEPRGAIDTHSL